MLGAAALRIGFYTAVLGGGDTCAEKNQHQLLWFSLRVMMGGSCDAWSNSLGLHLSRPLSCSNGIHLYFHSSFLIQSPAHCGGPEKCLLNEWMKHCGHNVKSSVKTYKRPGTSLVVQWLRLQASTAGGTGSIPGQGTNISHAMWCDQKKKKKLTKGVFRITAYCPS